MAHPSAAVVVVVTGQVRWVWCAGCQTSSRAEADVLALTSVGVTRAGTFEHCPRCAETDQEA